MENEKINITEYITRKDAGLWKAIKNAKGYGIKQKRFDPVTGEPVEGVMTYINLEEMKSGITRNEEKLANMKAIVADMEALNS